MDFTALFQQGAAHAWLYLPVAVLLGALHGLEPGHSKTMMAAFIIAVKGTIAQAALLGLSAAISHSLVIWALAALGLRFGSQWNVETVEPYLLIVSGVIVAGMALWTIQRLRRGHSHEHGHHHHDHDHDHSDEIKHLQTETGDWELSIQEDGVPPRFRLGSMGAALSEPVALRTIRDAGAVQTFTFRQAGEYWESEQEIPEPHAFAVEVEFRGGYGTDTAGVEFTEEEHGHDHGHHHHHHDHLDGEDGDDHARQHAEDIRKRFSGREVTTPQIVLFGLTGGLMPCPAALSILVICLQVKQYALGFSVVAAFSIGLALTLVSVGVAAAWGMRHVSARGGMLSKLAGKAPYLSSGLLILLGVVFVVRGVMGLA